MGGLSEAGSEAPPLPGLAIDAEFWLRPSDPLVLFVKIFCQVSKVLLLPLLRELFASLPWTRVRQVSNSCILPKQQASHPVLVHADVLLALFDKVEVIDPPFVTQERQARDLRVLLEA